MMLVDLKRVRQQRRWSQRQAAERLGVSQAYLSMLERRKRPFSARFARRAMRVYGLPPSLLPPSESFRRAALPDNQTVAEELARLGYPGFVYLRTRRRAKNPAEFLLAALAKDDLEPRLTEALPWVFLNYGDLDARWLADQARLHNLQNRLGFVVTLARRVAELVPHYQHCVGPLRQVEGELERSRLAAEDTLCQASLSPAQRRWLGENRAPEAAYWHLLTDWRPEALRYAV